MSLKRTALLAVIVTGIIVTLLAAVTATPDILTQLLIGVEAVAASAIVVFILLRIPKMKALPESKQQQLILVSVCVTGVLVCLLPLALAALRHATSP